MNESCIKSRLPSAGPAAAVGRYREAIFKKSSLPQKPNTAGVKTKAPNRLLTDTQGPRIPPKVRRMRTKKQDKEKERLQFLEHFIHR